MGHDGKTSVRNTGNDRINGGFFISNSGGGAEHC